jgi:murein DD-endopeptidase MepM/ murein hydrolase activator NlpD
MAVPILCMVYATELRRHGVAARVGLVGGVGAILVAGMTGFGGPVVATGSAAIVNRPTIATAARTQPQNDATATSTLAAPDRPGLADDGAEGEADRPVMPVADSIVTQATEAPTVVRFRPRDGWTDVDRSAWLSVRFTAAMDRRITSRAFRATVDGQPITGRKWWAEGDTVLVLDPKVLLPAGAEIVLSVDGRAISAAGMAIARPADARFTTVEPAKQRPAPLPATTTRTTPTPTGWRWPLVGPITQRFGETLTQYGVHRGIDIDGDTGDSVRAARSGVVTVAGYADECGGIQVRLDHGDGFVSWYRHLSAELVSVGQRIATGVMIGRVGSTGCSTGSHLHFAITRNGSWVDPERYLP